MSELCEEKQKLLQYRPNLEEVDDGKFKATCPFDQEEFVGDSLDEVVHEEGVYRSKNWIDVDKNVVHASDLESNSFLIKDWRGRTNVLKYKGQGIGILSESEAECLTRIIKKTCENLDNVKSKEVSTDKQKDKGGLSWS